MSYPIIFETKIVKLSDGRIIHFDRSGCNNDNAGRKKSEFTAKIYTVDEFINKAKKHMENSQPYKENGCMELKIGSRYATMFDYGNHLLRMLKRAKNYSDFVGSVNFDIIHTVGVQLIEPEYKLLSVEEFDDIFYKLLKSGSFSYKLIIEQPDIKDEKNLIDLIENNASLSFYISKKNC